MRAGCQRASTRLKVLSYRLLSRGPLTNVTNVKSRLNKNHRNNSSLVLLVHASVTEPRDAFAMFSACCPTSASVIYMLWHDPRHQSTIAWPGASNSCALAGNEESCPCWKGKAYCQKRFQKFRHRLVSLFRRKDGWLHEHIAAAQLEKCAAGILFRELGEILGLEVEHLAISQIINICLRCLLIVLFL